MNKILLAPIRQNLGNVVYTHTLHEIAAEKASAKNCTYKIMNILSVLLILIFLIFQLNNMDHKIYSFIGVGLTIFGISFLITQLFFNFEEKQRFHKNTALALVEIRENYINLISDIMSATIDNKSIQEKRNSLLNELNIIYSAAPQTSRKYYKEAQKRLNPKGDTEGEDFTFTEEEIDRFLPNELRITKK